MWVIKGIEGVGLITYVMWELREINRLINIGELQQAQDANEKLYMKLSKENKITFLSSKK